MANTFSRERTCRTCNCKLQQAGGRRSYCSVMCSKSARSARRRASYWLDPTQRRIDANSRRLNTSLVCVHCGSAYRPRRPTQQYCSPDCYKASRRRPEAPKQCLTPSPEHLAARKQMFEQLRQQWGVRPTAMRRSRRYGDLLERQGLPPNIRAAARALNMSAPTLWRRLQDRESAEIRPARRYGAG